MNASLNLTTDKGNLQQVVIKGLENSFASYEVTIFSIRPFIKTSTPSLAEKKAAQMFDDAKGLIAVYEESGYTESGFWFERFSLC